MSHWLAPKTKAVSGILAPVTFLMSASLRLFFYLQHEWHTFFPSGMMPKCKTLNHANWENKYEHGKHFSYYYYHRKCSFKFPDNDEWTLKYGPVTKQGGSRSTHVTWSRNIHFDKIKVKNNYISRPCNVTLKYIITWSLTTIAWSIWPLDIFDLVMWPPLVCHIVKVAIVRLWSSLVVNQENLFTQE